MQFPVPDDYKGKTWPSDEYAPHLIAMGRVIFCWNVIEDTFRRTLTHLVDGSSRIDIITAHMGSNTWLDAMRTISTHFCATDECDDIKHAIKLFERLREYRNFYVHGLSNVSFSLINNDRWVGMRSVKARGEYVFEEVRLAADELDSFAQFINAASNYYSLIHNHFAYRHNDNPRYDDYRSLPEKFPIPDRLPKNRRNPSIFGPRPQS